MRRWRIAGDAAAPRHPHRVKCGHGIDRAAAFVAAVLLAVPSSRSPQPAPTVFLEELTSPELAAQIRGGSTTVIVPIGGTEQNGPHMMLGKHNVRVKALSEKVARALGNAVVAPVIAYVPEGSIDPPTGHMRYAGTITVPPDVYRKVLESAARSFRLHGFRDIVFLGDSGDYQPDNAAVAAKLNREWAAARRCASTPSSSTTASPPPGSRRRSRVAASPTPRSARMRASPTPR